MKKLLLFIPLLFLVFTPTAFATKYTADNLTLNLTKNHAYSGDDILVVCANDSPNSGDDFKGVSWNGPSITGITINAIKYNQNDAVTLTGTPTQVQSTVMEGHCYNPFRSVDVTVNVIDPQPGTCGTANGQNYSQAPDTNLCGSGTAGTVSLNGNSYEWTCTLDIAGSCSATYLPPPPPAQQIVQATGQATQDNLLSLLANGIPYIIVVGAAFIGFRLVWKKVKGQGH